MEIQKIFSNIEDPEENLYSVLMSEDEIYLFSEFQKEFARKDYEGLSDAGKEALRKRRNEYARELRNNYRNTMRDIDRVVEATPNISNLETNLSTVGGGVRTKVRSVTNRNGDSLGNFVKVHKNTTTNEMLKGSSSAKDIMRNEILTNSSYVKPKSANTKVSVPAVVNSTPKQGIVKSNVPVPKTSRAMDILKKNKKALLIGGSLAAAGAGIGYGIHKHRQNKERQK